MEQGNSFAWLGEILQSAKEKGASDVHLMEGTCVMFRVDGVLLAASEEKVESPKVKNLMEELLTEEQKNAFEKEGEMDFSFSMETLFRVRAQVYRQRNGMAMCLHLLPLVIPSLEKSGIPDQVRALFGQKKGLFLIAGTSGSGKTTTLASMVAELAQEKGKSIAVLERPTEYLYGETASLVYQREITKDSGSYAGAVNAAFHQNVDVISAGEIDCGETIEALLQAAELGHFVIAVVKAGSVPAALENICGEFPVDKQPQMRARLARVLKGVLVQQLLPKQGSSGSVAAFELLAVTEAVKNAIREGKSAQITTIMQSDGGQKSGMRNMDDAIYDLYMKSVISSDTAIYYAENPEEMRRKVQLY